MDTRAVRLIAVLLAAVLDMVLTIDTLSFSTDEEEPVGTHIGNVKTEAQLDQLYPSTVLDQLTFTILPPDNDDVRSADYFQVEETTGILRVSSVIDRDDEELCAYKSTCQLTFEIAVGPANFFDVINVRVNIVDINDNSPHFSRTEYSLSILESALPGSTYNLPSVFDLDSSQNGIQRFEIQPNSGQFNITWSRDLHGRVQPKLELNRFLDREQIHTFDLSVVAYDSGSPSNSAAVLVHVTVQDTNDNSPEFSLPTYEARIDENTAVGATILSIHADDSDAGDSGTVRYTLAAQNIGQDVTKFRIDPVSGIVYLQERVDREDTDVYYLLVVATDQGKDSRQASTSVTIYVDDVNDNAPVIHISVITTSGRAEVLETADVGTFVALVSVVDRDWGQNAEATCHLPGSSNFLLQTMEASNKFKIVTDARLDREQQARYDLLVSCEDQGRPAQSSQETVSIYVTDVNDNAPVFSMATYTARIDENNDIGAPVVQLETSDQDIGVNGEIKYAILGSNNGQFVLEEDTGLLKANTRFDYETTQEYRLRVQARDGGDPSMSATSLVIVQIGDVNDQPPEFTEESFTFIVRENQMEHRHFGSVKASDGDSASNNRFWYSLTPYTQGASDYFTINRDNGSLTLLKPLDREIQPFYHLVVTATNFEPPSPSATVSVTILVDDINDNAPVVDFPSIINNTVQISSRLPPGYKVTQVRAHDLDSGENAELSYFLAQNISQEQRFGIDPKSGEVFLNHDMSHVETAETFRLRVLVKDNGVPERTSTAHLTVVVNRTLAVPLAGGLGGGAQDSSNGEDSDKNMTIIIIVVATSGVIIIVLLGSIVFVLLSSRRKHRHPQSQGASAVVMDNLNADGRHDNRLDPEGNSVAAATKKQEMDNKIPLHEEFQRYAPIGNKTFYSFDTDVERTSPVNPSYPTTAPPRGVFVNYGHTPQADLSFASEESDRTRNELQALTSRRPPPIPSETDRDSASSVEDSVTDSGRGASEEGDPTSADEHGHSRPRGKLAVSPRPHTNSGEPSKTEVILTPDYGLSQLQTQFDPHYQIKYSTPDSGLGSFYNNNSRDSYISAHSEADTGASNPGNACKQTVRNVKAKDKSKKVDPVNAAMNSSSVFRRYRPDAGLHDNPSTCTFSDANSLMNYKMMGSGCLSEITDATSETSATSGSYIIEHDDDVRGINLPMNMVTASHC